MSSALFSPFYFLPFSPTHSPPTFSGLFAKQPGAGTYLMSSSYDKTCKIFSCQDWSLVKTLSGHEDKVMRAEISPGAFFARSLVLLSVCWLLV